MKRTIVLLIASVAFGVFAVAGSAAPNSATLVIKHQTRGCHSWSLNGAKMQVVQRIHLAKGGSIVIRNDDVMSHQLIKTSGHAIVVKLIKPGMMGMGMMKGPFAHGMMGRMGATLKATFPTAGVYTLTTKGGEDYTANIKTIGEDNVLRAIVTVS